QPCPTTLPAGRSSLSSRERSAAADVRYGPMRVAAARYRGRLARVEAGVEEVAAAAAAARHLDAANDRDLADIGVKVDANPEGDQRPRYPDGRPVRPAGGPGRPAREEGRRRVRRDARGLRPARPQLRTGRPQ